MGYKFQFITLAGFHALNLQHVRAGARATRRAAWRPTSSCSRRSSPREADGYTATRHQREVGTGYFDQVLTTLSRGMCSTRALAGSTESEQFHP